MAPSSGGYQSCLQHHQCFIQCTDLQVSTSVPTVTYHIPRARQLRCAFQLMNDLFSAAKAYLHQK